MKAIVSIVVSAISLMASLPGVAQEYPNRPIKLVAPYPPGGQADVIGRLVCLHMGPLLNQQCVVENRPGAGGVPGTEFVVKSQPDGYVLLLADSGQWAVAPAMMAKPSYDPVKDLAPVGLITTSSMFIAVHSSIPANNLQEFIALVRSKPGVLQYGSSGNATVHHLAMETFKAAMGLDMQHIPYKGAGQSVPALASGQIPVVLAGLTNLAPFAKTGQVKVLGATTQKRSPLAPNVAGMAEAGASISRANSHSSHRAARRVRSSINFPLRCKPPDERPSLRPACMQSALNRRRRPRSNSRKSSVWIKRNTAAPSSSLVRRSNERISDRHRRIRSAS